jgi:hypothetical protein
MNLSSGQLTGTFFLVRTLHNLAKGMRILAGIFLILVISAFRYGGESPVLTHRFIVQPTSKLVISGKTNVNSFQCSSLYCGRDTLVLREGGSDSRPVFEKGYVGLDASAFDCGMQLMTHDFGKTIKAREYPFIVIDFISFERVPVYACSEERFKGKLKISLGGITNAFDVDCSIEARSNGLIHLKGGRNFVFSDFKLQAPTRMMGMVKVNETLDVNFHLILKLDPNS